MQNTLKSIRGIKEIYADAVSLNFKTKKNPLKYGNNDISFII